MRRFGRPKKKGQAYILRPGVYAILPLGNSLLLTHQSDPKPEYQLPGGGVDKGETQLAALHREVMEETGWRIAAPRRLGAFRRFVFMPEYNLWAEKVCTIYTARPVRKLGPPSEAGHQAVWARPDTAIKIVGNDGDRAFIQQLYAGSGPL